MAHPDGDERPFGLVLAGGLARRMAGRDKTLLRLAENVRLLDVLVARLAPQCACTAISANGEPSRFDAGAGPVLPDVAGPSRGPLAGVLAGLEHASLHGEARWMLTVPGDTPFIPDDLAVRLMDAARHAGRPVARVVCDGRLHSLVALWSLEIAGALRHALLDRDLRKVTALQAEIGTVDVFWSSSGYDPFFNVNTPEDLAEAQRLYVTLSAPLPITPSRS